MTVELNPVEWGTARGRRARHLSQGRQGQPRVFIKHIIIDSANIDAKLPKT